jgi:hypothetical protein
VRNTILAVVGVVVGFATFVFLAALIVAKQVAPGDETRQIAVAAIVVAGLSFLGTTIKSIYDIREKELEKWKKAEEKKKKVRAVAVFTTPKRVVASVPTIGVRVVNEGPSVNIGRIYFKDDTRNFATYDLVASSKFIDGGSHGTESVKMETDDCFTFYSQSLNSDYNGQHALKLPPDSFWIVIESQSGEELAKVSGDDIHSAVRKG